MELNKLFQNDTFDLYYRVLANNDFHIYDEHNDEIYENDLLEGEGINYFHGATKICIPFNKYILKKSLYGEVITRDFENNVDLDVDNYIFSAIDVDYERIEYKVYEAAKERCLENFFVQTQYIDEGVYIQERCSYTLYEYYQNRLYFEERMGCSFTKQDELSIKDWYIEHDLTDLYNIFVDEIVGLIFRKYYDVTQLKELENFFVEYDVNDVHSNNVGMWKNEKDEWFPKIFDFSGYNTDTAFLI